AEVVGGGGGGRGGGGDFEVLKGRIKVERGAHLAAVPHHKASLAQVRGARCDEAHDARSMVAQKHRRQGRGGSRAQIEHHHAIKRAGHGGSWDGGSWAWGSSAFLGGLGKSWEVLGIPGEGSWGGCIAGRVLTWA